MQQKPISPQAACVALCGPWPPRVLDQVNHRCIKVATVQGHFPRYAHVFEDEMFLVPRGRLCIRSARGYARPVNVSSSEFFVVPAGVPDSNSAAEDAWYAHVETTTTLLTGSGRSARTCLIVEQLR